MATVPTARTGGPLHLTAETQAYMLSKSWGMCTCGATSTKGQKLDLQEGSCHSVLSTFDRFLQSELPGGLPRLPEPVFKGFEGADWERQ